MTTSTKAVSSVFIWRRVHSLMGFWLVLYLLEHLLVNSQAALWLGEDGIGFTRLVNIIQALPYLQVIEVTLIGIPLAIHAGWGIHRALSARTNAGRGDGSKPSLPYSRNRHFTWQRLTSWILLVGIVFHVVQMRFLDKPKKSGINGKEFFFSRLSFDEGLYTLGPRLGVKLFGAEQIASLVQEKPSLKILQEGNVPFYQPEEAEKLKEAQGDDERAEWIETLASFRLKKDEVVAVSPSPGTAYLLSVRDTFKNPFMALFYTLFVLSAAFHAFHGFWTFLITWGVVLSFRSQKAMVPVSVVGIVLLSFFGLAAIWGSYWLNLRH